MNNTALKKSLRKKLSKDVIQLTRKDYEQLKVAERMNAANIINILPLLILRDKFGFGKVRLERYLRYYEDAVDSFNRGYFNLEDIQRVMTDEVKIAFYEEEKEL